MSNLTSSDFFAVSGQTTAFTPELTLSAMRVLGLLLPVWGQRFDGEPTVLPLPPEMPREVPRVILQSQDEAWRCEIAPGRVSVVWRRRKTDSESLPTDSVFGVSQDLIQQYRDATKCRVSRLAAVVSRIAPISDPGMVLSRHFCREEWWTAPFNRPENFEIHAHKKFTLDGWIQVNSWVRNKTGSMAADGTPERKVVVVEQDINTLVEDEQTRDFTIAEIQRFYKSVAPELDSILKLYYPGAK
jgi:hypothetical protein